MSTIIGIIGLMLLAAAWVPQAVHTIRTHERVDLTFNLLYMGGSLLLSIYSIIISDPVFITLNLLALALATTNLLVSLRR